MPETDPRFVAGPIVDDRMDFRFLVHLARLGAANIHPLGRPATAALISHLDLRPRQRVLEVGCGTGETMVRISLCRPARIDGADVLPEMLRVARLRLRLAGVAGRSGLYRVAPGAPLPFAGSSYDRVYTESVLGIQDPDEARRLLAEIFRVLRPGGRYVANEAIWREGVSPERIAAVNAACIADFGLRQASAAPWVLSDWLHLFGEAGFRVVAASLLGEELGRTRRGGRELAWPLLVSGALTSAFRLLGLLRQGSRRARARYRQLLERHREDGALIEARLFVLEKPSPEGNR